MFGIVNYEDIFIVLFFGKLRRSFRLIAVVVCYFRVIFRVVLIKIVIKEFFFWDEVEFRDFRLFFY